MRCIGLVAGEIIILDQIPAGKCRQEHKSVCVVSKSIVLKPKRGRNPGHRMRADGVEVVFKNAVGDSYWATGERQIDPEIRIAKLNVVKLDHRLAARESEPVPCPWARSVAVAVRVSSDVRVENHTSLWLGVRRIRSDSNLNSLSPDLSKGVLGALALWEVIPPCRSGSFQRCQTPGEAAWVASFCEPGILRIDLELTELSNIGMLMDLVFGEFTRGDISSSLSLLTQLQTIPAFAQAGACLSDGSTSNRRGRDAVDKAICVSGALSQFLTDGDQRFQLLTILIEFGIDLTVEEVVDRLIHLNVFRVVGDLIVFGIQTGGSAQISINIAGE